MIFKRLIASVLRHCSSRSSSGGKLLFQFVIRGERFQLLENHRSSNCAFCESQIEMNYFEEVSAKLHRLGIFHCDPDSKSKRIVIATRCGLFTIYIAYFLASAWYFVFEAETPRKRSESLIYVLGSLLMLSWYSAFLFQSKTYAALTDELNEIVGESKFQMRFINRKHIKNFFSWVGLIDPTVNLIYEKTKLKIEWMTKYAYSVTQTVAVLYVLLPAVISFFNYFTSGFSNESFHQSFPAS